MLTTGFPAQNMNVFIGGQVLNGVAAGILELTALAVRALYSCSHSYSNVPHHYSSGGPSSWNACVQGNSGLICSSYTNFLSPDFPFVLCLIFRCSVLMIVRLLVRLRQRRSAVYTSEGSSVQSFLSQSDLMPSSQLSH